METPCTSSSAGFIRTRQIVYFFVPSEVDYSRSFLGSNVLSMQGRNAVREDALAGFTQLVNAEVAPAVSLAVGSIELLHGVAPALDHEGDCIIPREAH